MRVRKFIKEEISATRRDESHICGVLVQVRPDRLDLARDGLLALPGVEIHHQEPDGRLVVTVEDTEDSLAGETLHLLQGLPGIVSASLVYHHHENGHHDSGEKGEAFT